jgi:hypothetical protein
VYKAFSDFCTAFGYEAINDGEFGKEVKKVFPGVERKRDTSGDRIYRYHGLSPLVSTGPTRVK